MVITLILFSLAGMVYQDIRYRKIHILLPIIIFISSSLIIFNRYGNAINIIACNKLFFIIVFALLIGYISIKNRKYINPFENYFGLGDLLFFMAITPLFLLKNYVLFFIGSMLFSIMMQLFSKKPHDKGIPLAGNSSLLLFISICSDLILHNFSITLIK